MTLTVDGLAALEKKPYFDQISLELLRQYYEQFLEPYDFTFKLDNGTTVQLSFKKKNFAHLIGIEKLASLAVPRKERYKYYGLEAYNNIQNGEITLAELKKVAKKRIKMIKDKLVFFYMLHRIIESPNIFLDFVDAPEGSQIQCKLLAYDSNEEVYVHLGIDEDDDEPGIHFPRTFFAERITDTNDGTKFIAGRNPLTVVECQKIKRTDI